MTGARWTPEALPPLAGRLAVVTGAASGLGFETARALARRGGRVVLADRNREGGAAALARIWNESPDAQIEFRPLELGDLAEIRRFAGALQAAHGVVDILVNVAGLLPPVRRATTRDGFELKFGVNYLGHFALTGLLLPALLRSRAARVVSVSSLVQRYARIDFDDLQGERRYQPQRAYEQAKLACLMFALELERRARAAGVPLWSLAAHPGVARTGLAHARRGERLSRLRDRAEALALAAAMRWLGQSAERGAWPLLYAAAATGAEGGTLYGPDGFLQARGHPVPVEPSRAALDPAGRERLWQVSEQLTGVAFRVARPIVPAG